MKRLAGLIGACCLILSGCTNNLISEALNENAKSVQNRLALASVLSENELYQRAQEEMRAGAGLHFYSTTSIAEKAMNRFMEVYPALKDKVSCEVLNDVEESYFRIQEEIQTADENGADFALIQNGANLQKYLLGERLSYNYFPQELETVVEEKFQNPVSPILVNSLLLANQKIAPSMVTNIWQLTEEPLHSCVYLKSPWGETVNMNFLVMLTSVEWTKKLEESYEQYYGRPWSSLQYASASYEWIARFLHGCDLSYDSATTLTKDIAKNDKPMLGISVFSKIRNLDESEYKNLNLLALDYEISGFSGFMYPIYATILKNTDCPYTSALFIHFLLSEEGFASEGLWNDYQGYYSPNVRIKKSEKLKDISYEGWKDKLVFMDLDFLLDNREEVADFIRKQIK